MAAAGFYQTNWETDEVTCYSCKTPVRVWSSDEDPFERHAIASPTCALVNKTFMSTFEERLDSFYLWPKQKKPRPATMAAAGFFHSNKRTDAVTCFSCVISVQDWRPQDDPLQRHVRVLRDEKGWTCPWLDKIGATYETPDEDMDQATQTSPIESDKPLTKEVTIAELKERIKQATTQAPGGRTVSEPDNTALEPKSKPITSGIALNGAPRSPISMADGLRSSLPAPDSKSSTPTPGATSWEKLVNRSYSQTKSSSSKRKSSNPSTTVQNTPPPPPPRKSTDPPAPKAPLSGYDRETGRCRKCLNIFKYDQNFYDHWQRKHAADGANTNPRSGQARLIAPKGSPRTRSARIPLNSSPAPSLHVEPGTKVQEGRRQDKTVSKQCSSSESVGALQNSPSPPRSLSSENARSVATKAISTRSRRERRVRASKIDVSNAPSPRVSSGQRELVRPQNEDHQPAPIPTTYTPSTELLLVDFIEDTANEPDISTISAKTPDDTTSAPTTTEATTEISGRSWNEVVASGPNTVASRERISSPVSVASSVVTITEAKAKAKPKPRPQYANATGQIWDAAPASGHESW